MQRMLSEQKNAKPMFMGGGTGSITGKDADSEKHEMLDKLEKLSAQNEALNQENRMLTESLE
jgi:hypothetical protein